MICEGCRLGKATRARKKELATNRMNPDIVGQFSMDIATLSSPTMGGHKMVLVFWDKKSGSIHTYLLKKRQGSDIAAALQRYLDTVILPNKPHSSYHAQILRSDGASEFLSAEVTEVCRKHNIARELSCAFSSFQNGGAERAIRTGLTPARTMLVHSRLPLRFWGGAVNYAAYIHNRLPSATRDQKSPFEITTGVEPDLSRCRIFGTRAWVTKLPNEIAVGDKMSAKAFAGVYLGPARKQNGNRFYVPSRQTVLVRESATYDTSATWNTHGLQPGPDEAKLAVDKQPRGRPMPLTDHTQRSKRTRAPPTRLHEGYSFASQVTDLYNRSHTTCYFTPTISGVKTAVPSSMRKAVIGPERIKWIEAAIAEIESLYNYRVRVRRSGHT